MLLDAKLREKSNYYCDDCCIRYSSDIKICEKCGKEFKKFSYFEEVMKGADQVFKDMNLSEDFILKFKKYFFEGLGKGVLGLINKTERKWVILYLLFKEYNLPDEIRERIITISPN